MLEYIYFVKCPGCEDEHFSFFNEAKDFAMSCLSQKPIITQIEVDRNDFGECVDSCDLGTIWSWEDMMNTDDTPTELVFTKDDLKHCNCGGRCGDKCACGHHGEDPEFADLDNSLDFVPDNFRKPVPADMTIEALVETMEENEDTIECKWCNELFDKSECRYEVDLGWLCDQCVAAIKSRGETLTFREGALDEAIDPREVVELEYPSLTVTLYGPKRAADDWDEFEHTDSFVYLVSKSDVMGAIWDCLTDEDVKDVPGGFETLEDNDAEWNRFMEIHFDDLFEKYTKQILDYFKDEALDDFRERAQEEHSLGTWYDDSDRAYDSWRDSRSFDESVKSKAVLEELEEPDEYRKRLADCPECGNEQAFDHETGFCIKCGFNI